ncbi:MAG TPA: 4-(cytidine 5'-diphospho)-2-C-methyl-D-erythritol kinase [Candidatus Omnitrophota bacterium]|nr:4-(cytidine 5'-diphospho)-2-C-methyl-D-erythritol kinase [Candidatus Omnitrophota bacterium]
MIRLNAFAKINLYLEVIGKRPDGYHEIDSIMQSVSLYDAITVTPSGSGIEIVPSDHRIPRDRNNTAYKAARAFFDRTNIKGGVTVQLEKNIPIAAGLAGGSADAAAVLVGMNRLFNAGLTESDLSVLGAEVGSDVPFCLIGGTCRCRGRGELVERIKDLPPTWFVLVKPEFGVSTKWVYENFDLVFVREHRLADVHEQPSGIHLYNDLEKVVVPKYPEVGEIKKKLVQFGCLQSEMSGSGPTVYGMAGDEATARKVFDRIKAEYPQSFLVRNVSSGVSV